MKRMKRLTRLYLLLLILISVSYSCSPTTDLTASWSREDFPKDRYDNVFVTALVQDEQARLMMEEELANTLRQEGVSVETSSSLFPRSFNGENTPAKEDIMSKINEEKHDAILTVNFIDAETDRQYVTTGYAYDPVTHYGWYGDFYGYYSTVYPTAYDPGYWTLEKTYFMETNLYDAENEKLVWSAQSKTYDPTNLEAFTESFAGTVVSELEDDQFIPAR